MAHQARVNEQPIYVPSLGQGFGPGGWDYDKSKPTGKGTVYTGEEWEAQQAAFREAQSAEVETDTPAKAKRASKKRAAAAPAEEHQADEQDPDPAGDAPAQTEE